MDMTYDLIQAIICYARRNTWMNIDDMVNAVQSMDAEIADSDSDYILAYLEGLS